ncbi:MAG: hypothetical protein ABIX01_16650 [Chitinophagaceae bacterium]
MSTRVRLYAVVALLNDPIADFLFLVLLPKQKFMSAGAVLKYSAEKYLEMEEKSLEKNEFYKGEIFAMAGCSWISAKTLPVI